MAILNESPPFMPIDPETREIWAILVGLGYYHVRIISYKKGHELVFEHKPWLKSEGSNIWKGEVINLDWAMRELPLGVALPLVKKVFKKLGKLDEADECTCHTKPCVCWHDEK